MSPFFCALRFGAGDANLYRYVGNAPTNATDPLGLCEDEGEVDILDEVNAMLDVANATGQTLRAGDLPIYGSDGSSTAFEAMVEAGQQISELMGSIALTLLSFVPGLGLAVTIAEGVWLAADLLQSDGGGGETMGGLGLGHAGSAARDAAAPGFQVHDMVALTGSYQVTSSPVTDLLSYALGGNEAAQYDCACFAAGTPLLTPEGDKPVEQFEPGDWILSAPEDDPAAPPQARQVEEVFVKTSPLLNLHVGGRVIRTTPEHPFYVRGKGWIPTALLEVGDWLRGHDGRYLPVEAVTDSGEVTTVYNLCVAEYHTYFVGGRDWAFSIWAHNAGGRYVAKAITGAAKTGTRVVKRARPTYRQVANALKGTKKAQKTRFVYRGLAKGENPAAGLSARAPGAGNSVVSHIAGKGESQWISTTTDVAVARQRFGKHGVVKIDLSKIKSKIVDVSRGIPGMKGTMLSNWAAKMKEILVKNFIPAKAITVLR